MSGSEQARLLEQQAIEKIKEKHDAAVALNDDLADHPELSGEEVRSSKKIKELLEGEGFQVTLPFAGLATAFKAVYGADNHKRKVALLAEYDALPEIGHACGHCVSGSISVLAGIALAKLQDELDADIHVIGTPAEETDGAKCLMVDQGVFNDYDMAIMIHSMNQNNVFMTFLAMNSYHYQFFGKSSHASAAPWEGRNALNAAQLMLHAVDMLRQHVTPDVRMHAIYSNGGAAPNIVPDFAEVWIYVRGEDREYLNQVLEKVEDCAKGAAIATQTTYQKSETEHPFDNLRLNLPGVNLLQEIYEEMGLPLRVPTETGSSDVGNVSWVCPAFHPTIQIAEGDVTVHNKAFADAVKTPMAHKAIAQGAEIIAKHVIRIMTDDQMLAAIKADFAKKQIGK